MKGHKISSEEQSYISNCVFKYWGDPNNNEDAEKRDKDYKQCLADCCICA